MFSLYNSLATPFGSTVMSPMEENGLAPFESGSESPSRLKADWNCLLKMLAFFFASVLRIPFLLSDVIPNASIPSIFNLVFNLLSCLKPHSLSLFYLFFVFSMPDAQSPCQNACEGVCNKKIDTIR